MFSAVLLVDKNDMDRQCYLLNTNKSKFGLGYVLFQYMKENKNKIFQYLADTNEIDKYGETLTRCIRTALKLKEKGVTRDDIISSCTHNQKNSIVPHLASLFLGVKTAHFDPNLSHLDTTHLLKLIKPRIIFVTVKSLPFMERCLKESKVNTELVVFEENIGYSQFSEYLQPSADEETFEPVKIDNVRETICILFSSGTTGLPKGICLSHYGLIERIVGNDLYGIVNEQPVSLLYTTLYWISSTIWLIKCITDGGSRVVCEKFDAVNTWKLIEKYKVKNLFLAPYHARDFLAVRGQNEDTSSLIFFLTGSAPVTKKLMRDLRNALPTTNIVQGYGQTEASGVIALFNAGDPKEMEMQNKKALSCGKIHHEIKWKVVDPLNEKILGPNERGELRYKTDYQMNGYYKIDSSDAYDSGGFIKSGDIVYYDEDECIYVVDRIKDVFKYKGWHIIPGLIEEVLLSHPAVKDTAVVGIPHELDGELPMGLVVLNEQCKDITPEDLELYVENVVPDIQRLRAGVKIVNSIARTTTGKIKRIVMQKMALNVEI